MKRSTKKLKYKLHWLQLELEEVLETNVEANAQFLIDFVYCLDEQQSKKVEHREEDSFKNTEEVAFHFRITTSGGTTSKMCHPFPISNKLKIFRGLLYNVRIS